MEELIQNEELYAALDALARRAAEASGPGALFVELKNHRAKYFAENEIADINVRNAISSERGKDETLHVYFVVNDGSYVHIFKKPV